MRRLHLYIRDIGRDVKTWNAYLMPFEQDLWIAVASWILFSVVLFTIMGWLGYKSLSLQGYDLIDHGLTPLSVVCNQGFNQKPDNTSTQMAAIVICLACGFILPAYSAFLISFLTVDRPLLPFTDFESFIKDGTYRLKGVYFNFTITYFKVIIMINIILRHSYKNEKKFLGI